MKILNQCRTTFLMVYNLLVFGRINISPFDLFRPCNFPIKFATFLKNWQIMFFVHKLFQKNWGPVIYEDKPSYPLPLILCLDPFMPDGNKRSYTLKHIRCLCLHVHLSIYDLLLPRDMKRLRNFFFERSSSRKLKFTVLNNTWCHVL